MPLTKLVTSAKLLVEYMTRTAGLFGKVHVVVKCCSQWELIGGIRPAPFSGDSDE